MTKHDFTPLFFLKKELPTSSSSTFSALLREECEEQMRIRIANRAVRRLCQQKNFNAKASSPYRLGAFFIFVHFVDGLTCGKYYFQLCSVKDDRRC